jgi:hypothetical protein
MACDADVLAGEAAINDIHCAAELSSVECGDVVPNRGVGEVAGLDAALEDGLTVAVDFAVGDGLNPLAERIADSADA